MLLTHNGARFELICRSSESNPIKAAGFTFDYGARKWWTGDTEKARKFAKYADDRAQAAFKKVNNLIDESRATDAAINVPSPKGLSFLPFQKAGIAYCLPRANTLIADEMGLGKTIQVCGVINADPTIKNILIVCPASLKLNWIRELMKWVTRSMSGDIAEGIKMPDTDIVICNYEQLKKLRPNIDKRAWDLVVFDECHYLKNPSSQRTIAALGEENKGKVSSLPIEARKRCFLTGTPILNKPFELWPIVRIADPEGLGRSFWLFVRRYCAAKNDGYGWDMDGASNLDDLQYKLRTSIMIRRLKADVLSELPPKRRQIIAIPPGNAIKAVQQEMQFFKTNYDAVEQAVKEAEEEQKAGTQETYEQATGMLKQPKKLAAFTELAKLRYATAVAKIPFVTDYIDSILPEQEKVVIFAHHVEVITKIAEHYGPMATVIHGSISLQQRQAAVDRFQTDPTCKVIVCSILAAGVGLTLTAASFVLFAELDWRPGIVTQAEDRLHRIGQLESVLVQHLVFDESLDARMAQKIVEKQNIIDKALDKR